MAERKRVDDDLIKTREELAQRVKDHMAQLMKAGDDLRMAVAERTRAEDALVKARQDTELKLGERAGELAGVRDELQRQIAERNHLEAQIADHKQAEVRSAAFSKLGKELGAASVPPDAARIIAGAAQDVFVVQRVDVSLQPGTSTVDPGAFDLPHSIREQRRDGPNPVPSCSA